MAIVNRHFLKRSGEERKCYAKHFNGLVVYNDTGLALAKGDLVYVSGWDVANDVPEVSKADADAAGKEATHVCETAIANGAVGVVVKSVQLTGVNTNGSTVGNPIYLSATAGSWTLVEPSAANAISQVVGRVVVVHASTGEVHIELEASTRKKIGSNELQSGAVSGAITASQVAGTMIADSAVGSRALSIGGVGSAQIASSGVSANNIADSVVGTRAMSAGAVGSFALSAGAVVPAKAAWAQPVYLGAPAASATNNVYTNGATIISNSSAATSVAPGTQPSGCRNLAYQIFPSSETAGVWAGGVTVSGYDILHNPITEGINATALNATIVQGSKCFDSVVHVSWNLTMADSLTAANTAGASLKIGGGARVGFPQSIGATDAIAALRVGATPVTAFTVHNSSVPSAAIEATWNAASAAFAQVVLSKL